MSQDSNEVEVEVEVEPTEKSSERVTRQFDREAKVPLFLRDRSEGQKGDAQDEKDKTGE